MGIQHLRQHIGQLASPFHLLCTTHPTHVFYRFPVCAYEITEAPVLGTWTRMGLQFHFPPANTDHPGSESEDDKVGYTLHVTPVSRPEINPIYDLIT
jgi:hypothetical protein